MTLTLSGLWFSIGSSLQVNDGELLAPDHRQLLSSKGIMGVSKE